MHFKGGFSLLKFIICLFVHLSYLIWLVLRETACGGEQMCENCTIVLILKSYFHKNISLLWDK